MSIGAFFFYFRTGRSKKWRGHAHPVWKVEGPLAPLAPQFRRLWYSFKAMQNHSNSIHEIYPILSKVLYTGCSRAVLQHHLAPIYKIWNCCYTVFHPPIWVVEQGNYHVIVVTECSAWNTASHDISAVYSVENIKVSFIMKLAMWYCVKSHGNYHEILHKKNKKWF